MATEDTHLTICLIMPFMRTTSNVPALTTRIPNWDAFSSCIRFEILSTLACAKGGNAIGASVLVFLNVLGLLKRKKVGARSFWLIRLLLRPYLNILDHGLATLHMFMCAGAGIPFQ